MTENVIEWLTGDEQITITAPDKSKLKNKVLKLLETNENIKVIATNTDGSIMAKCPIECLSLRNPKEVT